MLFENFDNTAWHDSSIEEIIVKYNDIIVELETDVGMQRIIFNNYIALDYIGQWDENIVDAIYEEKNSDIIGYALEKISTCNNTKCKGGGKRDINSAWTCVVIELIDGVCIRIVCDNVVMETK